MLTALQFIRYQLSADDCVRLETTPDQMFRTESQASTWAKEHNVAHMDWRGYVTVQLPSL